MTNENMCCSGCKFLIIGLERAGKKIDIGRFCTYSKKSLSSEDMKKHIPDWCELGDPQIGGK